MVRILFVCMGNICRSPTAQGVFERVLEEMGLTDQVEVDSAGTHAYHVGEPADQRSMQVAQQRGIKMSDLRAQKVTAEDLHNYDYILAMDRDNHAIVMDMASTPEQEKVQLFMRYASEDWRTLEVPDPYYEGKFDAVFDMVTDASEQLLATIRQTL